MAQRITSIAGYALIDKSAISDSLDGCWSKVLCSLVSALVPQSVVDTLTLQQLLMTALLRHLSLLNHEKRNVK